MSVRILLVEDNELNRDMLARRLGKRGFEVSTAENGQWALGTIPLFKPHVVLMDMNMPVMDGWETTRRIREMPDWGQIPVVALTAHATREDHDRCMAAGCDEFHVKPVAIDELVEILERLAGTADAT